MSLISKSLAALLRFFGSGKLALVVVGILILFSLAGATLPQKERINPDDIAKWQTEHVALTAVFGPIGLFHVFTSWPFMITLLILGVNTLTCTSVRFVKESGLVGLKGPKVLEKSGFYLLHLSLIILLTGGFMSAAMKLNGHIILTEGQTFVEDHSSYMRITEGPLRKQTHKNFAIKLKKIETQYRQDFYQTDVTSILDVFERLDKVAEAKIKVNHPFTYKSLTFTHQDIGFSPRIEIRDRKTGRVLFYSFVVLKTFDTQHGKEYRDYLPLPFLENRTIITVYPRYEIEAGEAVKTSEEPSDPLIRIEIEDNQGKMISKEYLPLGQDVAIGEYIFKFTDLRRWVSLLVVEDPGYLMVCASLWLGIIALLLRYVPDMRKWFTDTDDFRGDLEYGKD